MKGTHYIWISTAHAAAFTAILGFLHVFKFISWDPLKWIEKFQVFPKTHPSVKWMLLFLVVFLVINIVMALFLLLKQMPAFITSIVVGLVIWLLLEWTIYNDFTHIGWHSIPLVSGILAVSRALAETIVYYDRAVYDDVRK